MPGDVDQRGVLTLGMTCAVMLASAFNVEPAETARPCEVCVSRRACRGPRPEIHGRNLLLSDGPNVPVLGPWLGGNTKCTFYAVYARLTLRSSASARSAVSSPRTSNEGPIVAILINAESVQDFGSLALG